MAANDYYNDTSYMSQSSLPPRHQYNQRPISHIAFAYDPTSSSSSLDQSRQSRAYNSQRLDPNYYESNDPSHRPSHYSDSIPLKHKSQIDTQSNDDWRHQRTQYPPSPESQNQPPLLPKSTKNKKGWFSGKIPWVVYTLSLIQITVFIVEIIKNCKDSPPERLWPFSC